MMLLSSATVDTLAYRTNPQTKTDEPEFTAAAFQLTENDFESTNGFSSTEPAHNSGEARAAQNTFTKKQASPHVFTMNNNHSFHDPSEPAAPMFVRALYDYNADDRTSLSFRQGDVIQVLNQLESGWWDGVMNDVRGWFPSNYCAMISGPDDMGGGSLAHEADDMSAGSGTEDEYDDEHDEDGISDSETSMLPIEGANNDQEEAAFWIPQATPDGRLFYFNTLTGVSTMELPLENPTSANETGPRDRTNINVPDQTRPPPEMMARGYERDEDEYDESASELEGESILANSRGSLPRKRRSFLSEGVSPASSMDSMNASPVLRSRKDGTEYYNPNLTMSAVQQAGDVMPVIGTTATSFSNNPIGQSHGHHIPQSFADDGASNQVTWSLLVERMRRSVEMYKDAINNSQRSDFVRRAEDISDHLRMLLAAASGTTDNHSGNPSIISTNKALYPHFRDMMSRFSKLVLSSHIAAADWPGPDSYPKCLYEAEGVMHAVYGYVEVAKHQQGSEIPRLTPGFLNGIMVGGSWQDNNLQKSRDPLTSSSLFESDDLDAGNEPTTELDSKLLERMDELKRLIVSSIRRLDEHLVLTDKVITHHRHRIIGNAVCGAGGRVIEQVRPWISTLESINLAPVGNSFENPQLSDFSIQKQKLYDLISDLLINCQAVAGPLGDEWAQLRGESLGDRLNNVKATSLQFETCISQLGFSLQLLLESMPKEKPASMSQNRNTENGEFFRQMRLREDSLGLSRPTLGDIGHSQSYTTGDAPPKYSGKPSKVDRFFGAVPQSLLNVPAEREETAWYLALDHESEVSYDTKVDPPQLRSGTLTGLVEQLTRHDRLDPNFNSTFLLTYRSFTSATELFEMIVKRFNTQPPNGLQQGDYKNWEEKKLKPIRIRVVNILKSWFDNYWMEGNDDASMKLLRRVYAFAKDSVATTKTPGSKPLITVVEQRLKGLDTGAKKMVLTLNTTTPTPIMPKNMKKLKFLDIDATEFARQLTIIESRLYNKIKPTECLNKTWSRKVNPEEGDLAPNVKSLILHSNQLTNWVTEMILTQSDVKKRVVVIKHFVTVADKCRTLNNFSTVTSIISALDSAPIHRLSRTWQQVNARTMSVFTQLKNLMATNKNFREYREQLHLANPPCIPFFGMSSPPTARWPGIVCLLTTVGVYLTDLTFIEDGIPSVIRKTNLINFNKRAKTAEVIRDIQQYQNKPYPLQPVTELQDYILSNMQAAGDVHEMYDRSLAVEPREREDEKIAR